MNTIPVFVIEDNRLLRDEIAAILNEESDLLVVGVAESVDVALPVAREARPRVILMDAPLRDHDSLVCVESLKHAAPGAGVIMMDLPPTSEHLVACVEAGASGFIMKDATAGDVVRSVRSVAAGQEVLPPALAGSLFSHLAKQALGHTSQDATRAVPMTRREREVIDLIAQGMSNKEIAGRLNLTTYTIKSHVHHILEKLALHSRLELAAVTHQAGLQAETP